MGVRGLCNGFGPAAFGLMWHLFGIDITKIENDVLETSVNATDVVYLGASDIIDDVTEFSAEVIDIQERDSVISSMPGLPFLVISASVVLALICSVFLDNISIATPASSDKEEPSQEDSQGSNTGAPLATPEELPDKSNNVA